MKLRLRDLERLRDNPNSFGQLRPPYPRLSKNRALQLAVYAYHREGNDLVRATEYFEDLYRRRFKSTTDLDVRLDQLATYATIYQARGYLTAEFGRRITIVSGSVELGGEIPRLDLDLSPGCAYAVWLLTRGLDTWRDELRMPLIQAHFATKMGVSSDRVSVGIYDFETAQYEHERYSTADIKRAHDELAQLVVEIASSGP